MGGWYVPQGGNPGGAPFRYQILGLRAASIVGNNNLVSSRIKFLSQQCGQATVEQLRTVVRRHDDGSSQRHWVVSSRPSFGVQATATSAFPSGFSSRNDPITSASSGEVQNDSTASRGVHTIGSPRVLNEVLTRTGTPVRV